MGEIILNIVINGFVALLMIGIGISMIVGKEPTGFYTGEKAHTKDEIKDVKKWNLIHGLMFVIYGALVILMAIIMIFISENALSVIIYFAVYLLPLPVMILIHSYLEKNYVIKK